MGRHGTETAPRRALVLRAPSRVGLAALLLGGVAFALHTWFALGGYFAHDDFLMTHRAGLGTPVDPGYLFQDYNGHIAPGLFLLAWVVTALAPLNYTVAALPLLLVHAAALVVFWRLLVRCFGERRALLLPFGLVACSPVILSATLWWAYAAQFVPLLLCMSAALYCHVGYLRTGERGGAVAALVWVVVGLAFFEKAALIVGLLLGVTVMLSRERGWPALGRALSAHRGLWIAYGAVLALYGVLYFTLAQSPVREDPNSAGGVLELARLMVVDALVTPTLGIPVSGSLTEGSPALALPAFALRLLAGLIALAVVVGGLLVGRGRAVYAWVLLAGYLVVDVALVALARLPLIGPIIGLDVRYVADAVPVLALCAAFAYLTPLGTGERPRPVAGRALRVGLVAATALVLVGTTVSAVRLSPNLQFPAARQYVATARAALQRDPEMVLYDSKVPNNVMIFWFGDEGRVSRVLGLLPGPPRIDQPTATIHMLDGTGAPQEVTGVVNAVVGKKGTAGECGHAVTDQPTTIPLSGQVDGKRLLRLEYFTAASGPVTITAGRTSFDLQLSEGVHLLQLVVDDSYDKLEMRRAPGAVPACFVGVVIGEPLV